MQKLKVLHDAMAKGLLKGALIHEKSGSTHAVELLAAEEGRLIAVVHAVDGALELLQPEARVRVELPQESSVIFVPGRVSELRRAEGSAELEISCEAAEDRQRRMDVRIDSECRIRIGEGEGGEWEETRTVDISAGGALVVSDSRARIGEVVEVEMELDGHLLKCRAEVVRRGVKLHGAASRTSAALRFIGLSSADRERIALHVLRAQASQKVGRRR